MDRSFYLDNLDDQIADLPLRRLVGLNSASNRQVCALIGRGCQFQMTNLYRPRRVLLFINYMKHPTYIRTPHNDAIGRQLFCGEKRFGKTADFMVTAMEPVRAPDPVETPAKAFEHVLPQAVTFAGPKCRVVSCPIAFHRDNILSGTVRVAHPDVDTKTSGANLRVGFITKVANYTGDILFKRAIRRKTGCHLFFYDAGFRKIEEAF